MLGLSKIHALTASAACSEQRVELNTLMAVQHTLTLELEI